MKTIVITGSTRGIGLGLADAFLALGCAVTISGRSQAGVDQAVQKLAARHVAGRVFGVVCDVRDIEAVKTLWRKAKDRFGKIDVWINNAGFSSPQAKIWETSPEQARAVVETNLLGAIHGSMVAAEGMIDQGHGSLYIMEGMGSDGRMHDGLMFYGTTKYGLRYFTRGLIEETKGTPVLVGSLRPGMVITDLIMDQYADRPQAWERAKRAFNIIADRVETVAPWMAEQVLANEKPGARITWLTRRKLIGRFLVAPFNRRNLFEKSGQDTVK